MNEIKMDIHPAQGIKSEYDWLNLDVDDIRIGKVRCKISDKVLIIYSINIFEEYEGKGYGKYFIEAAKEKFEILIADRVRQTAIGFWEHMGFVACGDGNWKYEK